MIIEQRRVFAIGVGEEVDRQLVMNLAIAGNGEYTFINSPRRLREVVVSQLQKALEPSMKHATVDWGMLKEKVTQYPSSIR